MIQLIINRSLSKSKPFWQSMTKKEKGKKTALPASLCHLFIAHSQQLLSGRLPPVRSTRCLNRLFKYFYCWFIVSGLENGGALCGRTRELLQWVDSTLLDLMNVDSGQGGEDDGGSLSASPHRPLRSCLHWASSSQPWGQALTFATPGSCNNRRKMLWGSAHQPS